MILRYTTLTSTTSAIFSKYPLCKPNLSSLSTHSLVFPRSFSSITPTKASTPTASFLQLQEEQVTETVIQESEAEEEYENGNVEREEKIRVGSGVEVKLPKLTVKEKKELAFYAHGKKLKCQLVGKGGVTDGVVSAFIENLESDELLKNLRFKFQVSSFNNALAVASVEAVGYFTAAREDQKWPK